MGAPRLAASASGGGPSPRNSRTATPDRAGDAVADCSACALSTAGMHAASTAVSNTVREAGRSERITLFRRPATIDENVGARNEARGLRAQIARQPSDLLQPAPPPDRQAGQKLPVGLGVVDDRGIHVRIEGAGTNRVYRDSLAGDFLSQRSR